MLRYLVRYLRRIGEVIVDYRKAVADIDERIPDNILPPKAKMHYVDLGVLEVFKQAYDQIKDFYKSSSAQTTYSLVTTLADGSNVYRGATQVTNLHEVLPNYVAFEAESWLCTPCQYNDLIHIPIKLFSKVGLITVNDGYIYIRAGTTTCNSQSFDIILKPTLGTDLSSIVDVPEEFDENVIEYAITFMKNNEKSFQIARLSTKEGVNTSKDEVGDGSNR